MFKIYKNSKDYVEEEFGDAFSALAYAREREIECQIYDSPPLPEFSYSDPPVATWTKKEGTTWHIGTPDLTSREAGFLLGIKHQVINRYIRDKRLPAKNFGKSWMISLKDLEEFAKIPRRSGISLKEKE